MFFIFVQLSQCCENYRFWWLWSFRKMCVVAIISRHKLNGLMILVSTVDFSDIPDVTRTYFRHCVVGKFQDGRHMCTVKQYIDIFFDRIEAAQSKEGSQKSGLCPTLIQVFSKCPYVVLVITLYPSQQHWKCHQLGLGQRPTPILSIEFNQNTFVSPTLEVRAQRGDNPELYSRSVRMMVVKGVQGSTRARVEKENEIKGFVINFLNVVIAVDVLRETGNEFLQPKMPSGRSLWNIKFFGIRRSERFLVVK